MKYTGISIEITKYTDLPCNHLSNFRNKFYKYETADPQKQTHNWYILPGLIK
jgi:hypothetical protein